MFEFVEEALDAVAERVCGATDRSLNFAVGFGRDDRLSATALEVAAYGIAIVAFVGKHSFWCCGVVIDQVGNLAGVKIILNYDKEILTFKEGNKSVLRGLLMRTC